jgi:hypothetical protein
MAASDHFARENRHVVLIAEAIVPGGHLSRPLSFSVEPAGGMNQRHGTDAGSRLVFLVYPRRDGKQIDALGWR